MKGPHTCRACGPKARPSKSRKVYTMSRAAPKRVPPPAQPRNRRQRRQKMRRGYRARSRFSTNYLRLLTERYSQWLLRAFRCSGCGLTHIDPLGWRGRGQPLRRRWRNERRQGRLHCAWRSIDGRHNSAQTYRGAGRADRTLSDARSRL
jgi:hypothetical protein